MCFTRFSKIFSSFYVGATSCTYVLEIVQLWTLTYKCITFFFHSDWFFFFTQLFPVTAWLFLRYLGLFPFPVPIVLGGPVCYFSRGSGVLRIFQTWSHIHSLTPWHYSPDGRKPPLVRFPGVTFTLIFCQLTGRPLGCKWGWFIKKYYN
jgi:hypothetical protein